MGKPPKHLYLSLIWIMGVIASCRGDDPAPPLARPDSNENADAKSPSQKDGGTRDARPDEDGVLDCCAQERRTGIDDDAGFDDAEIDGEPVKAIQISANGNHTCTVMEGGHVRCWGAAADGQLGYQNIYNIGDDEHPETAGDVDIGGEVIQVTSGGTHTCALLRDHTVRCWGKGSDGQLGYGRSDNIGDIKSPAYAGEVKVGGTVIQLSIGYRHSCALLELGTVRCWGAGLHGRLGYGDQNTIGLERSSLPFSAGDIDIGASVTQISAGDDHTCALLDTGKVRCWGAGFHGRLGYGNTEHVGDDELPASVGDVKIEDVIIEIAAGGHHTCALLQSGHVRCWGEGALGQLGYANRENMGDDETLLRLPDVDVGGTVTQLSLGYYHTCALLTEGRVRCWGAGSWGQLGYANTENIGDNETPASAGDVDVGGEVIQISASNAHTCALLKEGTVRCWGSGSQGKLGYKNQINIGDNETPASAGDILL